MKTIQLPSWLLPPTQTMLTVHACGKTLRIAVSGERDQWVGLAIETDTKHETVQNFLDHHAHAVIGKHRTLAAGKRAAERYARKWLRERLAGKPAQLDEKPCACDEITS